MIQIQNIRISLKLSARNANTHSSQRWASRRVSQLSDTNQVWDQKEQNVSVWWSIM